MFGKLADNASRIPAAPPKTSQQVVAIKDKKESQKLDMPLQPLPRSKLREVVFPFTRTYHLDIPCYATSCMQSDPPGATHILYAFQMIIYT